MLKRIANIILGFIAGISILALVYLYVVPAIWPDISAWIPIAVLVVVVGVVVVVVVRRRRVRYNRTKL